jgi:hypothetical protein
MTISPLAGKPAPKEMLVDLVRLDASITPRPMKCGVDTAGR